ncbi:LysM peptidoglycan-binding domain-containing protein [Marilutibacter maris]|nr:LysM domain-containing protein [Lysobacter maris]
MERNSDTGNRANQAQTHVIGEGDALADLAERYGVTIQMLDAANPEQQLSVRRLVEGQELQIPASPMSVTAAIGEQELKQGSGSSVSVEAKSGGTAASFEWKPGEGSVKGAVQNSVSDPLLGTLGAGGSLETNVKRVEGEPPAAGPVRGVSSDNGTTTVSVEHELTALSVKREVESGAVAVEVAGSVGQTLKYEVTLPGADADPAAAARINPFDPTTLPDGASVTLNQADFAQHSMEATFRQIAISSQLKESEGASYSITREGDTVNVVMGPSEAVEAFNAVGLKTDIATAMLGRKDALESATLQTARFDLASPDGQAAFAHFVGTGEVASQTPGVSEVATIERTDFNSQTRMQLGLGSEQARVQADLAGPENSGQFVTTTYADGSFARTSALQYSDNVPLQVVQRFDADGNELGGMRAYRFTIDTDRPEYGMFDRFMGHNEQAEERNMAGNLNVAITGAQSGEGPIKPGDKVVIEFNEAQMQAFMGQVRAASPDDRRWMEQREADGQAVGSMEFAISMARHVGSGSYAFTENLHRYAQGADGDIANDRVDRIDATVSKASGEVLSGTQWQRAGQQPPELGTLPRDAGSDRMFDHLYQGLQRGDAAADMAIRDVGASDHARAMFTQAGMQVEAQLRAATEQQHNEQQERQRNEQQGQQQEALQR